MNLRARLSALYASGELAAMARQHGNARGVATVLGVGVKALHSCMERMRKAGELPSWADLRGQEILRGQETCDRNGHEWDGPETNYCLRCKGYAATPDVKKPEPPSRWPSVAAFDAGVPAPVVPVGHVLRGVSTLVDTDGSIKQQWIKTTADGEVDPADVLRAAFGEAMPKAEPITAPTHTADDLLACYEIGDGHLGLHAWRHDSGGDWDLTIAERVLFAAADRLVALSPPATRGLIVNIGDFFHADSNAGTTTKGTRVDVDTRWSKVLAVGIRLMRRMIERALEKHHEVTVINEIGNHDTHTSVVLAMCLAQFYENEPRVIIDTSPQHFHYYRFGKVLLMTHHGHSVKLDKLPGVMATDRPRDWGEAEHRHIITGHVHHVTLHEYPGVIVRTLGVLAPGDAWHTLSGYRSGRQMISEIYHREHGLLTTNTVGYHQLAELS